MNTATRTTARALRRLSFTFATDGSHAACLAAGADGGWYVESWRLPADAPATATALPLPGGRAESLRSQLVALPDGRVLVCRHDADRHTLALLGTVPDSTSADDSDAARDPNGGPGTASDPAALATTVNHPTSHRHRHRLRSPS